MNCLVTGVAGFIGSHLAEKLIGMGHEVIGIDCFTDFYNRKLKENNLENLTGSSRFTFQEKNLLEIDLEPLMASADYMFHQAAQAGVRPSWGRNFDTYTKCNITATHRVLEAATRVKTLKRLVNASSSSVYGDEVAVPMREDCRPLPVSPYGVTKLAAENLCHLYWKNYGVPVISLRYFTVYGPRQRPDMAFSKFIKNVLSKKPIAVYGDGEQTRDFTFVEDAVQANINCMEHGQNGAAYNIGGGSRITVNGVLKLLGKISGEKVRIDSQPPQKGDMRHTYADTSRAQQELDFRPNVSLEEGLRREYEWHKGLEHELFILR